MPLLSARPAVTPPPQPLRGLLPICCLVNGGTTGVNSLPKTVTRQRRGCDLNPGPSAPESSTLATRLPSHPQNSTAGNCRAAWWWCMHAGERTAQVRTSAGLVGCTAAARLRDIRRQDTARLLRGIVTCRAGVATNLQYSAICLNAENSRNSQGILYNLGENCKKQCSFSSRFQYVYKTAVDWVNRIVTISGTSDPVR